MFDNLTKKFTQMLRSISGQGRLTENNITNALREVRIALLEADVSLSVVRKFVQSVKEKAIGEVINNSLTPGQEFIKIVKFELIKVMGEKNKSLNLKKFPLINVIILVGLQGSGKTTTVVKLGKLLKEKQNKKILTVSTDVYRAAAFDQLKFLTKIAGISFFPTFKQENPIKIAVNALKYAKTEFYDVLIIDTAGCLHIDKFMMEEVKKIHENVNPIETLFVADSMMGQDAINSVRLFNNILPLTGIILTKVDGDARGGVALSIRYITGKPIKFLGSGEKVNDLEPFYPERVASRILGMGDVLSLIEEIEEKVSYKKAKNITKKFQKKKSFDLNDFLEHLRQMRKMGGIKNIFLKMFGSSYVNGLIHSKINDKKLFQMEAIINSMTVKERKNSGIIKGSRKRRIALGSGTKVQDVNQLLKQFYELQKIAKKMKTTGLIQMIRNIRNKL